MRFQGLFLCWPGLAPRQQNVLQGRQLLAIREGGEGEDPPAQSGAATAALWDEALVTHCFGWGLPRWDELDCSLSRLEGSPSLLSSFLPCLHWDVCLAASPKPALALSLSLVNWFSSLNWLKDNPSCERKKTGHTPQRQREAAPETVLQAVRVTSLDQSSPADRPRKDKQSGFLHGLPSLRLCALSPYLYPGWQTRNHQGTPPAPHTLDRPPSECRHLLSFFLIPTCSITSSYSLSQVYQQQPQLCHLRLNRDVRVLFPLRCVWGFHACL